MNQSTLGSTDINDPPAARRVAPRTFARADLIGAVILAVVGAVAPRLCAQTPFIGTQNWTTPVGVNPAGDSAELDMDQDGTVESYLLPSHLHGQVSNTGLLASPNRQILYLRAFGSALQPSCSNPNPTGNQIYFFRFVKDSATTGHLQTILGGSLCINGPQPDHDGLYEVAGQSQHVAYIVEPADFGASTQSVHWINLNGVEEYAVTTLSVDVDLPFMFEPTGLAALFKHHVGAGGFADFTLIDLCPPPRLGTSLSGTQLFGINENSAALTAETDIIGGTPTARIMHPSLPGGFRDFTLTPCVGAPVMGACCIAGNCTQTIQDDCSGTWSANESCTPNPCEPPTGACCLPCPNFCQIRTQAACEATPGAFWGGPDTDCTSCPSFPFVLVSKSGPPGPVAAGAPFNYTLTYTNLGHADASGVQIRDVLPASLTFISASHDGDYNSANRTVTWMIAGGVPSCSSGQVTLTVRAACSPPSVTNSNYSSSWSPGMTFPGGPSVTTQIVSASAAPVSVTVDSVPSAQPLLRGDTITHTIHLTNTAAESRSGINFNVSYGPVSGLDSVIDAGGGTVTSNSASLTWTGTLGAGASVDVTFRTRIMDCTPASATSEQLNSGNPVLVRNVCSVVVGSAVPPGPFALQRPTTSSLLALPPTGAPQAGLQLVRPNAAIDLQLTLSNLLDADQPNVSGSMVIPSTMTPVGNPPFIPPTDSAAVYDDTTQTISWSGPISANASVNITFRATSSASTCSSELAWVGFTGDCHDLDASITLVNVPTPPAEPHLVGINEGGPSMRIWTYRHGIDAFPLTMFCTQNEISNGMGRGPNGDIWIAGVPCMRINPTTLDFQIYPQDFAQNTLGISPFGFVRDVAVDPADGTVVFVGYNQGIGLGQAKVVRYDPISGQANLILDGAATNVEIRGPTRVVVEPDGHIGMTAIVESSYAVVRIDPGNPGALQTFNVPNDPAVVSLALDTDDDYLVTGYELGDSSPRPLNKINRVTGDVTTLIADLKALVPSQETWYGSAVAPDGKIFLTVPSAAAMGLSALIDRGPPAMGESIMVIDGLDIEYNTGAVNSLHGDMNCDGNIDGADVQAFVLAVIDTAQYAAEYSNCNILNGDFTGDDATTNADTADFVSCLLTGPCP